MLVGSAGSKVMIMLKVSHKLDRLNQVNTKTSRVYKAEVLYKSVRRPQTSMFKTNLAHGRKAAEQRCAHFEKRGRSGQENTLMRRRIRSATAVVVK